MGDISEVEDAVKVSSGHRDRIETQYEMLGAALIGRRKSSVAKGKTLTEEEIKGKSVCGEGGFGDNVRRTDTGSVDRWIDFKFVSPHNPTTPNP
ncbi:hypothetical protein AND_007932 [Anopheles darlingi]|uniref:Uncharacterized protein n=1 Tax=Anopheles darlingi TaxID=43151 RepID=W5JAL6_ANODA|nr:hypothetical protein AND_007932 [Anopheles darlingi]